MEKARLDYMNETVNRKMDVSVYGNMDKDNQKVFSSLYDNLPKGKESHHRPGKSNGCSGGRMKTVTKRTDQDSKTVPRQRPDWDQYFLGFAKTASTRGTCDRKRIGAVIVLNTQIVATGYNGSVYKAFHCDDVGHLIEDGHCIRTIHAEMNALAQAARRGASVEGSTIYSTASPCWSCFRVLVNAGISRYVYGEIYHSGGKDQMARIEEVATSAGVCLHLLHPDSTGARKAEVVRETKRFL